MKGEQRRRGGHGVEEMVGRVRGQQLSSKKRRGKHEKCWRI